jgi:hypothetical protein
MVFAEGMNVCYKDLNGVVAFVSEQSISILVRKGSHRSHDVKIVVYQDDYKSVSILGEK